MDLKQDERIDDLGCEGLKVIQNKNWFCFGVDAVLLANFACGLKDGSMVLDLGTGTGIIPTLLCGKTKLAKVIGVEIQKDVCEMARRSIKMNQLENRFEILEADLKELDEKLPLSSFDVIVTNPPYKKKDTGIPNENPNKVIARHEVLCNLDDIIRIASKLLKEKGELYMVHRPERLVDLFVTFRKYKIEPKTIQFVQGNSKKKPLLVLIKAIRNANSFLEVKLPLILDQSQKG